MSKIIYCQKVVYENRAGTAEITLELDKFIKQIIYNTETDLFFVDFADDKVSEYLRIGGSFIIQTLSENREPLN